MLETLTDIGAWLNSTDLHFWARDTLRGNNWVSPLIQSIHIVSVAAVIVGLAIPMSACLETAASVYDILIWGAVAILFLISVAIVKKACSTFCALFALVFTLARVPETKGKTPQELLRELNKGVALDEEDDPSGESLLAA